MRESNISKVDVCIVSLVDGLDAAYGCSHTIQAQYRCPVQVSTQQQAVDYSRYIMLHHIGIPKYLKAGQSLVWGRS